MRTSSSRHTHHLLGPALLFLGRRAEATLLLGDAGDARRFEIAFALASFCGVHAEKDHDARVELPLPCGIWGGGAAR